MDITRETDKILKKIWNEQLPDNEKQFLYELLDGKCSHGYEIDYNSDYSLYLAYNASKHNYKGYDDNQITALRKILSYHKTRLLLKIPEISKIFHLLNENGVIPVLIKGVALVAYYNPNIPRMMDDIDIYIKPDQYEKAISILMNDNYTFVLDNGYHYAIESKNLGVEIHKYIYKNCGDKNSNLYINLIETNFLSSKGYVLSPENMFIHQLANRGYDILTSNHPKRHFKWIIDCYSIIKDHDLNYESIIKKAKELKNYYFVLLTLTKFIELFPNKINNVNIKYDDINYLKFLQSACKLKEISDAVFSDNKPMGLNYIINSIYRHYLLCKLNYYSQGGTKSFISIFFSDMRIHSMKDFFNRYKNVIANSKKIKIFD